MGKPPEAGEAPIEQAPEQYLAFRLEDECYGLPLEKIREIVRAPPLTEVPRAVPNLLGVMNLRGEVLPVYDLKVRLRLRASPPKVAGPDADPRAVPRSARVVVLRSPEGDAGVLVDAVLEVLRVPRPSIEPPPAGTAERGCISGLARRKGALCILLDPKEALA